MDPRMVIMQWAWAPSLNSIHFVRGYNKKIKRYLPSLFSVDLHVQVKIEKKYTKYNLEMTRGALADYHNYNQNENNGKISI